MKDEALKLALEALKEAQTNDDGMEKWDRNKKAITAIKEALAQPEQEPADLEIMASAVHDAYINTCDALGWGVKPENRVPYSELTEASKELDRASVRAVLRLVVPPPQHECVELTDEDIDYLYVAHRGDGGPTAICEQFARAVLAKSKDQRRKTHEG